MYSANSLSSVDGYWKDLGLDDYHEERPPPKDCHLQVPSTASSLGQPDPEPWGSSPHLGETMSSTQFSSDLSAVTWATTPVGGPTTWGQSTEIVLEADLEEELEKPVSSPPSSPSTSRGWSELQMALGGMDAAVNALAMDFNISAVPKGVAIHAAEEESTDEMPSYAEAETVAVNHEKRSQDSFGGLSPIKLAAPDALPDLRLTEEATYADSTDDAALDTSTVSPGVASSSSAKALKARPEEDGEESTDSGEVTLEETQLLSVTATSVAWASDRGLVPERGVADLYQYF